MNMDPHRDQPVLWAGTSMSQAPAAMVMLHGRGGTAKGMLRLAEDIAVEGIAYLAPQAEGNSWYPNRFMTPIMKNEPWLSSGLAKICRVLEQLAEAGIRREDVMLMGFSQGACLALEYVAHHAQRYGGVAALSGGLIGPDDTTRDYTGSLVDTPVFLGCSDTDSHIPMARVLYSAEVLRGLGARVTDRLYPKMGHTINQDEISILRSMMAPLLKQTK